MRNSFIYIVILFAVSLKIYCQESPANSQITSPPINNQRPIAPKDFNSIKERLYVGGNVGAWFGSSTYINVSPLIGYKITKELSFGITGTYNYYSQTYNGQKYVSTIYGGGAFGRYNILENFFAQAAFERLSVLDYTSSIANSRAWVDNILLGGGYRQSFSERGSFVAAIFYNINQTPLSPYPNPIIQIGFNIGL